MPERIVVEELSKVYAGGVQALDRVSLDVEPGTFLVLLGPSGSGKTTLLRSLAGVERISAGRISIGDTVVANGRLHLPPERRDLSMVFQDFALWPHLVARDNVAFALRRRELAKGERGRLASETLARVGMAALGDRYPNELSGGEQQRVALARALVAGTGLVLCDEPLSNLDADLRERMRVEISLAVRAAGATTIYITHDQAEAFALGDRIGVLEAGRLVQLGAPEEIYATPASSFVARFTGLAGELPVRIRSAADARGFVEIETIHLRCARPLQARPLNGVLSASEAVLAVRPTGVEIGSVDADGHHLLGTVADVAFRGRGYEHAVELTDGTRLTGVLSATRSERGETVGLRFDPAGCLVLGT